MLEMDEDATVTQLARAWIYSAQGGDKAQDAAYIFQELLDKFSPSPLLLNGLAVANMQLKKYDEAEKSLLEALEKTPKDPDTLINLAICSSYLRKPQEQITRYTNQAKQVAPRHPWVQNLKNLDESFSRNAARYK
eukprot:TRINITY_DN2111_c0_g3_i2.p1 TRINITY_DN2111_c0_g3~~TRINITY_DN2111_c0_g3_i2.p1  ORF type:complete len:135 (+),score=37.77 TRINITY_DN2111_c0_g3_i2:404-808(+)